MNKIFKALAKDTIMLLIGSGSGLLVSFFMIPVYTSVLSTTAFGISDLINTTVSMLLPIVSLNIFTAVFRWTLEENANKSEIFSNGLFVTIVGAVFFVFLGMVSSVLHVKYIWAIGLITGSMALVNFFQNFYRGGDKLHLYAVSGIVGSVVKALLNVLLMIVFKFGLFGYLISIILSNCCIILFLIFFGKASLYWDRRKISKTAIYEMFKFSIPMIPNAFTWWMTNDISRIIILMFLGPAANGLYAIANKIPSMIFTIFNLFQNAWQISSVKAAKEKEEANKIYSIIFNGVVALMIFGSAIIVSIVKVFMSYYVSETFFEGWKIIPILLLTALASNVSNFLGTTYLVNKSTSGLFTTTLWGTFANLFLSFALIPSFGIKGAAISGTIGFGIVSVIRLVQTRKWVEIRIKWNIQLTLFVGYCLIALNEYSSYSILYVKIGILAIMLTVILIQGHKIKNNKFLID